MAKETENRMNIVAINRVDPYVKEIVDSSSHVAFYTFNNEWEKTDIEGALFIYSRNAEPFHSIFINNRLNTNSLVEPITGQVDIQCQPPFLLYRNERSKIRGFWFYNKNECDRIGELINRIVQDCKSKTLKKNSTESGDNQIRSLMQQLSNPNSNSNILSMLTKAQEDFNKCSIGSLKQKDVPNVQHSGINNPSVMSFFAAIPPEVTTKQHLKTNGAPPVHTVDEIEKQHRASTPLNDTNGKTSPHNAGMRLNRPPTPETELGTSPIVSFFNSVNLSVQTTGGNKVRSIIHAKNVSEIEQLQQLTTKKKGVEQNLAKACASTNIKPALMPPTMFKVTNAVDNSESTNHKTVDFLTKEQMVQALNYLLKYDPSFVDKLHDAYLKSVAIQK